MIVLSLNILDSSGDVRVVVKDMVDAKRLEAYVKDANKALEAWDEAADYDDPRGIAQGWVGKDGRP